MNIVLVSLFSALSLLSLQARDTSPLYLFQDTVLSCNDLVQVSLDENCEAYILPDMILEGYGGDPADVEVKLLHESGDPVSQPVTGGYAGDSLYAIAIHLPTGQSCWGKVLIEDKWAPSLTCSNYSFACYESPANFPPPTVTDNCDSAPKIILTGEHIDDDDLCAGVVITRTYLAKDKYGNVSEPCVQVITTTPPALPDFPEDTIWSCETYEAHPNVIAAKRLTGSLSSTGSGVPDVSLGDYCPYDVVYEDLIVHNDCSETFTVIRTWTVINWCTNEIITEDINGDDNQQLIKVKDIDPPHITLGSFIVNANIGGNGHPGDCASVGFLPAADVVDNCHGATLKILTSAGEAEYLNGENGNEGGFIPMPGLELGEHTVIYQATDDCGNTDTLHVTVIVKDQTAPVTTCDEYTTVALGVNGWAEVAASVFDDGSYDNCCLLDSFLVRRMDTTCLASDTLFGETVSFCCADVGDTVQVVFRAVDCAGNTNDCMVFVEVEEKIPPLLESCPPFQTIDCRFYTNFLEIPLAEEEDSVLNQFGLPVFKDNCGLIYLDDSYTLQLDQCLQGNITRRWSVTDPGNNDVVNCTQVIKVVHISDWVVEFPPDKTVECGNELPETGEPAIFFEECELIAISFEDELFDIVPDACFKIVRTWMVMNWCAVGDEIDNVLVESPEQELNFDLNYDGLINDRTFKDGVNTANFDPGLPTYDAAPDGFIVYQQIIKVNDTVDPVVACPPLLEVCIGDTTCTADVELPLPDVQDCSPEPTITATGDLGTGLGPFTDIPPGDYQMTYQVYDNCGNAGFCQTLVQVRDCKLPTPLCEIGFIVTIGEDSMIVVTPNNFDAGSYDNCPGDLIFSFSADVNDNTLVFDCSTLGFQLVNVWVTDAAGNQDFCESFVFVDDPNGVCQGQPLISGVVETAEEDPVSGVVVSLNGNMNEETETLQDGIYAFDAPEGGDYTISPSKTLFPLNGVTTFDLVLISKHILGIQVFSDPFKVIAADANLSNSVTTFDLVVLRKLILQIDTQLLHGRSWRFIDSKYSFPNPANPFEEMLPEVINLNNLSNDVTGADFRGIKIGDVNYSADPGQ